MNVYRFRSAILSFTLIIASLTWVSCDKEDVAEKSNPAENPETMAQIESFFSANQPEIQSFQLSAGNYNLIEGAKGTKIEFPPDVFVDATGNVVTGTVSFELQEIFSPADMIFAQKMTVSNGQVLGSGGEFYMNAQQNGQDISIASGKQINLQVPASTIQPQMGLFVGNGSGSNFDWNPRPSTAMYECKDSLGFPSYCFSLDTLFKWINCDYFFSDPRPLTEVEIQVPTGYTNTNTVVMGYIPSISSMLKPLYDNGSFYIRNGYQLPVGLAITFIGVHHDGTDMHYSIQNATVVNNHVEVLSFQVVTQAQLVALLTNL